MTQLTQSATVARMPRQRRDDRPGDRRLSRINIEVYDDEVEVIAQAKAAAVRTHQTFRAWVINALREQVRREARPAQ
jgi:hypothetical protein